MSSARIWSSSVARRALMGHEPTHNPSPAAASLIQRRIGKRRLKGAVAFLGKRRRRFHKGNPLPAALAVLGSLGGLGKRFRASSDKRAAGIAPAIVAVANSGNLNAAKALIDRSNHPMNSKEARIWEAAQAQLSPQIMQGVGKYIAQLGEADMGTPESFAASVAALPVIRLQDLVAMEKEERASRGAAAEGRAARAAEAAERREARFTEAGAAIGSALLGRGRRPGQRRKRRRKARTVRL